MIRNLAPTYGCKLQPSSVYMIDNCLKMGNIISLMYAFFSEICDLNISLLLLPTWDKMYETDGNVDYNLSHSESPRVLS